jgi:hypothetical protein
MFTFAHPKGLPRSHLGFLQNPTCSLRSHPSGSLALKGYGVSLTPLGAVSLGKLNFAKVKVTERSSPSDPFRNPLLQPLFLY